MVNDCVEPMSDSQHGSSAEVPPQRTLNRCIGDGIDRRRRFVQDENAWTAKQCAREANQLPLPDTVVGTCLSDDGVKATIGARVRHVRTRLRNRRVRKPPLAENVTRFTLCLSLKTRAVIRTVDDIYVTVIDVVVVTVAVVRFVDDAAIKEVCYASVAQGCPQSGVVEITEGIEIGSQRAAW
jgi:hypothetical protein